MWTSPRTYAHGEILTATIANLHWRDNLNFLYNAPSCGAKRTTQLSIVNNTFTAVTMPEEEWDNDGMHSTSVNTDRITAATAGRYLAGGWGYWLSSSVGTRFWAISHSGGGGDFGLCETSDPASGTDCQQTAAGIKVLSVGQFASTTAFQNSGGSLNILIAWIAAHWVGN